MFPGPSADTHLNPRERTDTGDTSNQTPSGLPPGVVLHDPSHQSGVIIHNGVGHPQGVDQLQLQQGEQHEDLSSFRSACALVQSVGEQCERACEQHASSSASGVNGF